MGKVRLMQPFVVVSRQCRDGTDDHHYERDASQHGHTRLSVRERGLQFHLSTALPWHTSMMALATHRRTAGMLQVHVMWVTAGSQSRVGCHWFPVAMAKLRIGSILNGLTRPYYL